MHVSVFDVSIQQYILTLTNLKNILTKADAYAKSKNIATEVLLQTRLFPDMFPLAKQIITACDAAKFCGSRLSDATPPLFEEKEGKLEYYMERIEDTIKFLKTLTPEDFEQFEKKKIKFAWNPGQELNGKDYLVQFAMPNFFFHVTTAYNILRSCGVELGKVDYLGKINWQSEA